MKKEIWHTLENGAFGHLGPLYLENSKRYKNLAEQIWKLSLRGIQWKKNPIKIGWKMKILHTLENGVFGPLGPL